MRRLLLRLWLHGCCVCGCATRCVVACGMSRFPPCREGGRANQAIARRAARAVKCSRASACDWYAAGCGTPAVHVVAAASRPPPRGASDEDGGQAAARARTASVDWMGVWGPHDGLAGGPHRACRPADRWAPTVGISNAWLNVQGCSLSGRGEGERERERNCESERGCPRVQKKRERGLPVSSPLQIRAAGCAR
eukprot:351688-Chlamydomonas_euryale.AAC.1